MKKIILVFLIAVSLLSCSPSKTTVTAAPVILSPQLTLIPTHNLTPSPTKTPFPTSTHTPKPTFTPSQAATPDLEFFRMQLLTYFLQNKPADSPVIGGKVLANFAGIMYPDEEYFLGRKVLAKVPVTTISGVDAWWIFSFDYQTVEGETCMAIPGLAGSDCLPTEASRSWIEYILDSYGIKGKSSELDMTMGTGGQKLIGFSYYVTVASVFGIDGQNWIDGNRFVGSANLK